MLKQIMDIEITDGVLRLVGVVAGLAGTYSWIRNAKSPRKRSFLVKASTVFWIFSAACLIGMQLLSKVFEAWLALIFVIGLMSWARLVGGRLGQFAIGQSKK